jgi:hypothetical protein
MNVLAAGKAVGKQRVGARLPVRAIEQRGKFLALGVGKVEALSRHALLRWTTVSGKAQQDLCWPAKCAAGFWLWVP